MCFQLSSGDPHYLQSFFNIYSVFRDLNRPESCMCVNRLACLSLSLCVSESLAPQSAATSPPRLDVDPGEGVSSGGGDVGLGGVEGHVVDGLLALLTVSRDLLNACFTVEVPQTQGAVVT